MIIQKIKEAKDKLSGNCSSGHCGTTSCADGAEKCKITAFVCCFTKKLFITAICLLILLPIIGKFLAPKFLHRYLMNNADVIIESVQKFSEKKQKELREASAGKVSEVFDAIVKDAKIPFFGNKKGSHTVVLFYDYACGHCKRGDAELQSLAAKDPELKVILHVLPLFGAQSIDAARAAMFVFDKHPDKFATFHAKMIALKEINPQSINGVAKSVGIKEDVVKASKSAYDENLRSNYERAGELRIDATPSMIVKGKMHFGFKTAAEVANLL